MSDRTEAADHTPLAPLTAFGIARAQQQLDRRGSTIGVIATGVERWFAPDDPLATQLPATAFAGGADELNDAGILQVDDRLHGEAALTYRNNHVAGALRRYLRS